MRYCKYNNALDLRGCRDSILWRGSARKLLAKPFEDYSSSRKPSREERPVAKRGVLGGIEAPTLQALRWPYLEVFCALCLDQFGLFYALRVVHLIGLLRLFEVVKRHFVDQLFVIGRNSQLFVAVGTVGVLWFDHKLTLLSLLHLTNGQLYAIDDALFGGLPHKECHVSLFEHFVVVLPDQMDITCGA